MEEILKTLRNEKSSLYFRVPVDAKKLNVPTYYVIVKKPMDLATMAKKIRFQEYSSLDDFESDFDLIVSNCILFNGEVSVITNQVKEMESIFRKLIEEARHRISSINERPDQNNSK